MIITDETVITLESILESFACQNGHYRLTCQFEQTPFHLLLRYCKAIIHYLFKITKHFQREKTQSRGEFPPGSSVEKSLNRVIASSWAWGSSPPRGTLAPFPPWGPLREGAGGLRPSQVLEKINEFFKFTIDF